MGDGSRSADAGCEQAAGSTRDAAVPARLCNGDAGGARPVRSDREDLLRRDADGRLHAGTGRQLSARVQPLADADPRDRKSVVEGQSVSVRVDLGGRRIVKKKKLTYKTKQ